MTKVFVVILNWNRKDDTLECLETISELRITNCELRIVVVDNASTDGSVEALKKSKLLTTNHKLLVNEVNLGYAAGNNVGMRYSLKNGADFVMILNNDTIVDKDLVVELLKVVKKHPRVGAVSPKIYFAKGYEFHNRRLPRRGKKRYKKSDLGKVIWYAGGDMDWDNIIGSNHGVDEVDRGQFNKVVETDFATGTCMFLARKAINAVGIFDEKYFMYYEDTDLAVRMKKAGFNVLYAPAGLVWHKVAQSSAIGSELNDYYITRNRLLFGAKYASLRTKFALIRESIKLLLNGRRWQKIGVRDFYLRRFGRASWR